MQKTPDEMLRTPIDDSADGGSSAGTALFHQMLDRAPDGAFIIGANGLRYANAALAELLGRPLEHLLGPGFDWFLCIHPEDRPGTIARLEDRLAGRPTESRVIYRVVTPAGHLRYLEVAVAELPGTTPELLGIARDVTARLELEAAARRTHELLRAVSQASELLSLRHVEEPHVLEAMEILRSAIGCSRVCAQVTEHPAPLDHGQPVHRCAGDPGSTRGLRLPDCWHVELAAGQFVSHSVRNTSGDERAVLTQQGVGAMLTVPLIVDGFYRGFLHFDSEESDAPWSDEELAALRTFGVVFSNALGHREADTRSTESEARFQRLVENAPDMIYRVRLSDGIYEYVSAASGEIIGYAPEEFYVDPRLMQKVIHPGWLAAYEEQWARSAEGEVPAVSAYAIIHGKTGETRWLHQRNVLIRDGHGRPVAVEGIASDITPQKLAETRLREREDTLQSILRAAPIGIGLNTDRTMLLVNEWLCKMTGYTVEELVGETTRLLYATEEEWDRVGLVLVPQLERGDSGSIETQWRRKDGTVFDVLITATCLTPEDYAAGVTFTAIDISELVTRWQARERGTHESIAAA